MIPDPDHELQCAYRCASENIRWRIQDKKPIPKWLRHHLRDLERKMTLAEVMSDLGRDFDPKMVKFRRRPEFISAQEAAAILGISDRHVTRIRTDLDGTRVGGRWIFPRAAVLDYHNERHPHIQQQESETP